MADVLDYFKPSNLLGHLGPGGRYIYDNIFDDKARYIWDDIVRHVPVAGDILRTKDSVNFYDDYFRNRPDAGGYGNIKYHRANLGLGAGLYNSANFLSRNIVSFYDDDDYIRGMKRHKNNTRDIMFW